MNMKDAASGLKAEIERRAIGMTLEDLRKEIPYFRVMRRDGKAMVLTRDYKFDRLNVAVENDVVTEVKWG